MKHPFCLKRGSLEAIRCNNSTNCKLRDGSMVQCVAGGGGIGNNSLVLNGEMNMLSTDTS